MRSLSQNTAVLTPAVMSSTQNWLEKRAQTRIFFRLGFTPFKAKQPLRGMELQEKEAQKY